MNFPYWLRLLCLCFASFFLIHIGLSLIVWLCARPMIRLAERMRPRSATTFLFISRMIPAGLSLLLVLALCVPSYLWLEPESVAERIGFACVSAALLGFAIWSIAIARSLWAAVKSLRYTRQCRQAARETTWVGEFWPAFVVERETPLLALTGVIHTRLLISRGVVSALTASQLDAALRHENAHRISHDNLKRLLLLLAPDVLQFSKFLTSVDRAWTRLSEWAADDHAAGEDSRRALSLAGALVRVARMGVNSMVPALLPNLIDDDKDLSIRVDRLLHTQPSHENPPLGRFFRLIVAGATLAGTGLIAAAMLWPSTLTSVHAILERLIH
ncbi:MAG: hypothetical protein ACRD4K_07365 [Candidatus Acidiferrales bacterium]